MLIKGIDESIYIINFQLTIKIQQHRYQCTKLPN